MDEVDPQLQVKIKEAKKLIAEMAHDKKYDAFALQGWLRHLNWQRDCLKYLLIKERKKMDLMQLLLDKLHRTDNAYRSKSNKECFSANHRLHRQMLHGSQSLRKEVRLLEDMKLSQQQEDNFVSYWTQVEKEFGVYLSLCPVDHMRSILAWHYKMPVLTTSGDPVKDRILEFLEWRRKSCGVELGYGCEAIATDNVNVKGTTWTPLGLKRALQEQIKVAGEEIDETRKTQLALGLGKVICEVERESEAMKRGLDPWRKNLSKLNQRKDDKYRRHVLNPRDRQSCSMRLNMLSYHHYCH